MRILIVSVFFPPLNSIASHRPYSWAKYWTQAGHDVTVLTTPKIEDQPLDLVYQNPGFRLLEVSPPRFIAKLRTNYHQSQKKESQSQQKLPLTGHLKNWFVDTYHYMRFNRGIFNACRMPDFLDLWISPAVRAMQKEAPFDLVVSTSGPYAVHYIASKLKKLRLARAWIADFRDLWTDNHVYPGVFPFNRIEGVLEKRVLRHANAITIVSHPWAESLSYRHGHHRVHVIENGFDPDDIANIQKESVFPSDGKFRLVHTGNVYAGKQSPHLLFAAIRQLDKSITDKMEVIFAGTRIEHIAELIKRYSVGHCVKTHDFVKRDHALAMQRDAHAVLLLPWSDPAGSGAGLMTGKIYEYLYSRTPILAVGGLEGQATSHFIKETGAGVILNNVESLVAHLTQKVSDGKKEYTQVPPAKLEEFSRKTLAFKLLNLVH